MFASQAHSFRKQARLATTLSWVAGYTNALTILTVGQVTSHVSGTVSQVGLDVADGRWHAALYMAAVLGVFAAGAAVSGFLTEIAHQRRWASIYVLPMIVEAVLLGTFALLIDWNALGELRGTTARLWLTLLPAFAMGLQNATVTRISGGVVRTTHVTGVLTDLGMESAIWAMRRTAASRPVGDHGTFATGWRLLLLAGIVGGFALGAGLAAAARAASPRWSMVPAVAFLGWIVLLDLWRPIGATRSDRDAGGTLHLALPAGVGLFHVATRGGRFGRRARLPNLTAWAERLEAGVRVVVLDVAGIESLDADAATELRALAERLAAQGRALVLAGVTPARYRALAAGGVLDAVDPADVCPDLELAAAHAMTLLERVVAAR
jgi:uncharacterized membrane protein YoaK (UPF0700 family)/anti-anti-sigma regulatory factor